MIMIERVARALCEKRGFGFYTDPMEGGQDAYDISSQAMEEARAAIAAMREPEPHMVEMAYQKVLGGILDCWRNMIDAALSEGAK